ncbi:Uma2 family endonuclease [Streptomyces sp. HNM0663]|uniref:Uma2 family endonuclease n=1 Tax=Streptomyces chengmaiensis TaxID=3040919 RepID=A0ABT6HUR8_9ACTN|nr:Uma2 family endonuclease [Streptomyces chengmaiensis]MDH2391794.1 Uma2 family endonuclease [Streptomyces chengmaiensis]
MSVEAVFHYTLPDTPYAMWVRDELHAYLRLPEDGTRVEVVGGEIIVSPGPTFDHNAIVADIQEGLILAKAGDSAFPWRAVQTTDLNLVEIGDGYIPDLIVMDADIVAEARAAKSKHPFSHQLDLVVEVTSPTNAAFDREPVFGRDRPKKTKWTGYAQCVIPYYLLIDRDPKNPGVTLYANPDRRAGRYEAVEEWKFGGTVALPEPFGFSFDTSAWEPWA